MATLSSYSALLQATLVHLGAALDVLADLEQGASTADDVAIVEAAQWSRMGVKEAVKRLEHEAFVVSRAAALEDE